MSAGASPQLEDGYIKLANELAEALMRAKLTARQWPMVMTIIHKAYAAGRHPAACARMEKARRKHGR